MNAIARAVILMLALASAAPAAEWQPVPVPGKIDFQGEAWLRSWVKVHDSFFQRHERNLFEESVGIHLRDLAGAHEVWVNGVKIGAGGDFPPEFRPAGGELYRHKVPVGTLRKGEWNEIAVRVYQPEKPGGFLGDAPFIMNYFLECVFEGQWEFLPGGDYRPGEAVQQKPPRATFDSFHESHRVLGRTDQVHGASLPPKDSAAQMQAFEGLKVELLLHEPLVRQPFQFSFDERGRLWIAQTLQYPYPAGLKMLSRDKYYRSHYDKVPAAPPNHPRGSDVISIHEDTDRDGTYDKHKVFVDGLNMANSVVRGRGGVWVMHTPYLIFYPDKDGDDVPDGPPVTHLAGFNFEDSHSMSNGLTWGPDGWLYGCQGSTVSCRIRRPGLDPPNSPGVYFEGCMVWRYHPETRAFEIFAEGGGNTFGLELDAAGRLYSGHNGGKTRGWHFIQGGFYLMQGVAPDKFGPPRNPYAFGDLPMMATPDPVVRFTHFGAFAEGSALPRELAGQLLAIDPLHNEIIASRRETRGATFSTKDHGVVVKSADPAFRPVYIANAPDGSLHVADMYEFYIAHGQHYQNQIDPTTGRMYRVAGKEAKLETDIDLAAKTADELVALLGHPNKWHRHTAVRLLGERKDASTWPALKRLIAHGDGLAALNALWGLYQAGGFDSETALVAIRHANPLVRVWAVRLLGDDYGIQRNLGLSPARQYSILLPTQVMEALLAQAAAETDAEVRSQLASTARRLAEEQALALAAAVMRHQEDVDDPYIPLLCWWVLEALMPAHTDQVLGLFQARDLWDEPLVVQHVLPRVVRRLAVDGKRQDLLRIAALLRQAPGKTQAGQLLTGFEEAYRGRSMAGLPDELATAIAASGGASLSLRLRQGEPAAVKESLALVASSSAKPAERERFARYFGELRHAEAVPVLLKVATEESTPALRQAVFAALGAYDRDDIAPQVLESLPKLPENLRVSAFTLLASRPKWTQMLLDQLQAGKLNLSLVPGDVADQLRAHRDQAVREKAVKLFPPPTSSGYDFQRKLAQVETALAHGAGNPYQGEATFMQRCANCHKLLFKGGNVGPDLTTYQRDNLGTMLISIVNPSAEIREGFQTITIETADGRVLTGFPVDRDEQVTVLRTLSGQDITLRAAEIENLLPTGRSLMPEGLLEGLTDQQLRDLFAYLRISQPISK
jgi:putative membrane-bound dehydrogenase-like protein